MKSLRKCTRILSGIIFCGIIVFANSGCDEESNPTSATSSWSSTCSCSSNRYNCDSFLSSTDAQLCYNHCINLGAGDIHDLDRDNDGNACEDWGY